MFQRKTVFVIGAGGSADFGLPLGSQLRTLIGEAVGLRFDEMGSKLDTGSRHILKALRQMCTQANGRQGNVNPLRSIGCQIQDAMHGAYSIDNFLQMHSENQDLIRVGKLGIAHSILESEAKSNIYTNFAGQPEFNSQETESSWLTAFMRLLLEGWKKLSDDIFENVSIITFNYDRCIEEFSANFISNQWLLSEKESRDITNKLNIIHAYGTVGALPWQSHIEGASIPFGQDLNYCDLNVSSESLITFSEQDELLDGRIIQSRDVLFEAEQVVFVGFSFMPINMRFFQVDSGRKRRRVLATALDISDGNREGIDRDLSALCGPDNGVMFTNGKGAQLISDNLRLLSS